MPARSPRYFFIHQFTQFTRLTQLFTYSITQLLNHSSTRLLDYSSHLLIYIITYTFTYLLIYIFTYFKVHWKAVFPLFPAPGRKSPFIHIVIELLHNYLLPVRLAKAFFIRFSTSSLWVLVIPGERPNPSMFRPTRIRVEWTGAEGSMFPWSDVYKC